MNYDQNFSNPQPWNQSPAPAPRPPKNPVKWIIISVVIVAALGGLFYLVASLGKKVGDTFGKITNGVGDRVDSINDAAASEQCNELIDEVNMKKSLTDSMKMTLTDNLGELRNNVNEARRLLKLYGNGYNDTLQGQNAFSALDKRWAHEYLIKTGRATNFKNALLNLKDQSFNHLPSSEQDSTILETLKVYDTGKDVPDYLSQFTSWENIHFDQPAVTVRMNFNLYKTQIRNYENEIIRHYRNYLYNYE